MQKLDFSQAVDEVTKKDRRFDREAYFFLRDALDYTVNQRKKRREKGDHVTGQQLLEGIRHYALKQYGPMVVTVFDYWNVQRCEDFGIMVYSLIQLGTFGKTETDSIEDFKSIYTFEEAFLWPFQPERQRDATRPRHPARELTKGVE